MPNIKSLRLPFGMGRILLTRDLGEGLLPGNLFFGTNLKADHISGGLVVASYDFGSGLVTNAGVAALADDWVDASKEITNFNFHDSGTGTTAAAVGDTDLQTAAGPTTRATGTKSNPSAPEVRTVGTISYTSSLAITEWGLFDDATRGSDTMWDRRVFSAINVVNGDSIQFTYTLTVNAGG